jgi:hypothetical protein
MLTPDERSRTLTYLHALRRKEGGYADHAGNARSGLQHTANAWKALCLLEDQLPEPRATLAFVHRCFDAGSGGFRERPGGAPTVLCTALALGLLRGLGDQGGLSEWSQPAARFLTEQARSAMDHFFVVAAHEEGGLSEPPPAASVEFFRERRQADGTFGDSAFANAIACCALLRAPGKLPQPAPVVSRLLQAQTSEGGFADLAGPPDLLTTYAATRALALLARLREAPGARPGPDLAALERYLRGLRRPEGGFAMRAGGATGASATYHALAVSAWTLKLRASGSAAGGAARAAAADPAGRGSRTA